MIIDAIDNWIIFAMANWEFKFICISVVIGWQICLFVLFIFAKIVILNFPNWMVNREKYAP